MKSIGVFWGYQSATSFDQEGIGRYFFRLIEGMLSNLAYRITVAVQPSNQVEVQTVLQALSNKYRGNLQIKVYTNIATLNKQAGVDIWIIPSVSLEAALQLDKPYILCLHDLIYRHSEMSALYRSRAPEFCRHLDELAPRMCHKAAVVVFNSEYIRQHDGFKVLGLPKEKTVLIRPSAPVEEFQSFGIMSESLIRQQYQLHGPYIIFPSAIRYHKNHERLSVAYLNFMQSEVGRHSNLQLVFTDHLNSHPMGADIANIIHSSRYSKWSSQIRFLGRISSNHLPSLYRYAKGTIVPTLFEGSLPFPILESLTMDTPTAVSRIAVTEELVKGIDSFIHFNPYSVQEIELAIRKLWHSDHSLLLREKKELCVILKRRWHDVALDYGNVIQHILK